MTKETIRVRIEAGNYSIRRRKTGEIIGAAVMTGVPGRDTFPWEASAGDKALGCHETLAACVDAIEHARTAAPAKSKPLFAVGERWRIVRVASGRRVAQFTTEYISEDDAIDSDRDALEIAIARLGYRVERDEEKA